MIKQFTWIGGGRVKGQLLKEGVDYDDQINIIIGPEKQSEPTAHFKINWYDISGTTGHLTPKFEAFNDSWNVFQYTEFLDLLQQLENTDIQPEKMVEKLKEIGFTDETEYENGRCPHCYQEMS